MKSPRRDNGMIVVTRLNKTPIVVNPDLIVFIEETPDTIITLSNGEKMVVQEKVSEVIKRVIDFRRSIFSPSIPIE
jgi:flagellar protein FlbD